MKHLRYTLLATTVLVCADLAAAAPASDSFGVESPVRPGGTEVVKPTPGEKVALKQRKVFVKERFIKLFCAEAIEELGLNWETLRDASVSFEHPDKRHAIYRIKDFLRRQSRALGDNEVFESIYTSVLRLSDQIFAVHLTRLEDHARRYFQTKFPGATVEFSAKLDGVQLGSIARVNHEEGKVEKFYIKTHSSGLASERSSTPGSVNPKSYWFIKFWKPLEWDVKHIFLVEMSETFTLRQKMQMRKENLRNTVTLILKSRNQQHLCGRFKRHFGR